MLVVQIVQHILNHFLLSNCNSAFGVCGETPSRGAEMIEGSGTFRARSSSIWSSLGLARRRRTRSLPSRWALWCEHQMPRGLRFTAAGALARFFNRNVQRYSSRYVRVESYRT